MGQALVRLYVMSQIPTMLRQVFRGLGNDWLLRILVINEVVSLVPLLRIVIVFKITVTN